MRGVLPKWSIHEISQSFKASDRRQAGFRGFWQVIAPLRPPITLGDRNKSTISLILLWVRLTFGEPGLPVRNSMAGASCGNHHPSRGRVWPSDRALPPGGAKPQLQPGQGEPIPTDGNCGNPGGAAGLDGKPNFFGVYP